MVYLINTQKDGGGKSTREEDVSPAITTMPGRSPSKPLHNFVLPSELRWGNQKILRCMNVNSIPDISAVDRRCFPRDSVPSDSYDFLPSVIGKRKERDKSGLDFEVVPPPVKKLRSPESSGDEDGDGGDGIAAVREKLIFDIRTAADKLKDAILKEDMEPAGKDYNKSSSPEPAATEGGAVRPWNLRTRRAACKSPATKGHVHACPCEAGAVGVAGRSGNGLDSDAMKNNKNRNSRLRNGGVNATVATTPSSEKKGRAKFSVALTKSEIEEDFLAFARRRPARRPKKRPKYIQTELDMLFPGLWLTEVTADMYKVEKHSRDGS